MGHEGHDHERDGDRDPGHDHHHHHHDHDRDPISKGGGAGKVLFLDAPSGLAGDMVIAALVDLGVPRSHIAETLAALPIPGLHAHFGTRERSGIVGTSFEVHAEDGQPQRTYGAVRALIEEAKLTDGVKARAGRTFLRLAQAEAKVHRMPLDDVHFHEVGAVDAIADVVGSAAALEYLSPGEVVVSPLPMGRGFVKAAHGTLPLPAPATVECLAGFVTYDAGIDFEFVTPTGAAIVGAHASRSERWPSMRPERVGWGAGTANLPDRPNLLRAVLGTAEGAGSVAASPTHAVIEANVDDATGELAASWIEALMAAGALDAWTTPITMKKGRPALTIAALAPAARATAVAHTMLRETTSLGVRTYEVSRLERTRRFVNVDTPYGVIPIKIAEGPFGPPQVKPEFDACAAAARAHAVPVREVLRAALVAALETGKAEAAGSSRG